MNKKHLNTISKKAHTFGLFLNKNASRIAICMMCAMAITTTVFATQGVDTLWNTIANLIQVWVTRLGGVVMLIGGVMFGLGWKSDDPEQRSRGISTIVAGAIVAAVAGLTGTFFA